MKPASAELIALIDSGSFFTVDLYTLTLASGPVIRLAEAEIDITFGGDTWLSGGPFVSTEDQRQTGHWKVGLDVDSWQMTIIPRASDPISGDPFPDRIGSTPWLQAAANGALDAATVLVQRAYFATVPDYPQTAVTPVGLLTIFLGMTADVELTTSRCTVTVNDMRQLLSISMPRNIYQPTCRHVLYDSQCTLSRSTFSQSAVTTSGSTASYVIASAAVANPGGSNSYVLGRLAFTSGKNAGFSRTIAWTNGTEFSLYSPLPYAPSAGDAFNVSAGCDKQLATCSSFGNAVNFGGFPYIPVPESTL